VSRDELTALPAPCAWRTARVGAIVALLLVVAGAAPGALGATRPSGAGDAASARPLTYEGDPRRQLLDSGWYYRPDDARVGRAQRWFAKPSLEGWLPVSVPHNWNATDTTENRQAVGWYRTDFQMPRLRGAPRWRVRFEGVNKHATIYLNGRLVRTHASGYFPFEADLTRLRAGRNTLVVRVSTRRSPYDLTHWHPYGSGGWWNFGGILREVYLRPLGRLDLQDVRVLPKLRCLRCDARLHLHFAVRNLAERKTRASLSVRVGARAPVSLAPHTIPRNSTLIVRESLPLKNPALWRPGRPVLYPITLRARARGSRAAAYRLRVGVKHVKVRAGGKVFLNGRALNLRGASVHEDDVTTGGISTSDGRRDVIRRLKRLNATVARAHYPLHPALIEAFDRNGILYWAQAPVYQLPRRLLARPGVRAAAVRAAEQTVRHNTNNASVFVWSIANELESQAYHRGRISPGQGALIRAAADAVRRIDRTRLVAIDRNVRLGEPLDARRYGALDALGLNQYFGWYPSSLAGMPGATIDDVGAFLDKAHAAFPKHALFITEFGVEATRSGPREQKGTLEFQSDWLRRQLQIQGSKRYLNGSIVWLLKDYRHNTTWLGGNDPAYGTPPWNNKGLIDESGSIKPAFWLVREAFMRTRQLR
jgi:beta-glucuronidase